jgi:hypothetical protein
MKHEVWTMLVCNIELENTENIRNHEMMKHTKKKMMQREIEC